MDGQGYIRPATTLAQDELLKTLQEGIDFEAERLGLGAPVREPEAKNPPPAEASGGKRHRCRVQLLFGADAAHVVL